MWYIHRPSTRAGEFHAQRGAAAARLLDATSNALDVDYSPEAVEAILSAFNDRVLQAIQDEDRVDDILHDHLRETIVKTVEDPAVEGEERARAAADNVMPMVQSLLDRWHAFQC